MSVAIQDSVSAGNRYRDAPHRPDYVIDQDWGSYSAAEHER